MTFLYFLISFLLHKISKKKKNIKDNGSKIPKILVDVANEENRANKAIFL